PHHASVRRAVCVPWHPAGDRDRCHSRRRHGQRDHRGGDIQHSDICALVRGNTLSLKHLTFIEAARSIGASDWTIVIRHIFPGTIAAVVVYFSLRIGTSIITAASLSFIGVGAQPPTLEWGAMLHEPRADMMTSPHVAIFPSLAIFLTVLAFNLLGDGLRDALDPKIDQKSPRRSARRRRWSAQFRPVL